MIRDQTGGAAARNRHPAERYRVLRVLLGRRSSTVTAVLCAAALFAGIVLWILPARTPAPQPKPSRAPTPVVNAPSRLPGSDWLEMYAAVHASDEAARHLLVLEQVARRNMPETWDHWATVTATGRNGTVVAFEVSPHGLRIGTNSDWVEVPLDGPHFAAAAEILGHQLATEWMVEQTYLQARSNGGAVHYFAAAEIANSLALVEWKHDAPDGEKMRSPEFFQHRSTLLQNWLHQHSIDPDTLVSGYFKCVVLPIDGLTRHNGLEMIGGHTDQGDGIQPLSGGFHARTFFDYSHNIRLAKNVIRVNGQVMTLRQFWSSVRYAVEFGFRRTLLPDRAYPYPPTLRDWMEENGYLRYPLDVEASRTTGGPSSG